MCRFIGVFLINTLFLTSAVWAQNPSSTADLTATGVGPNDIVISVQGFCDPQFLVEGSLSSPADKAQEASAPPAKPNDDAGQKTNPCRVEVTRAQFEKMVNALGPQMRRSDRIRLGVRYAEGLAFAEKAKQLGLVTDPDTEIAAKYGYLQFLSTRYQQFLQKEVNKMSDAEVKAYYDQHPDLFVQAHFLRIFVPNQRHHADVPKTPEQVQARDAADQAAMKSLATKLRARAVAGASFEKLESEAYAFAGESADDTPDVDLGQVNRSEAPPELQGVFDLKPGQISDVIESPKGWHIVKLVSREQIPLSQAKTILLRIRLQEAVSSAKNSVHTDFSDAYFNTEKGMDPTHGEPVPR